MNAFPLFQLSVDTSMTVILVVISACFLVMAVSMIYIATVVGRVVKSVTRLESRVEPLIVKISLLSDQGRLIAAQGKEIAEEFNVLSGHLSAATMHFAASAGMIEDEVRELKMLVSDTAETARDKVAMVSRTIDQTQLQVTATTQFIRTKVLEPARELAAIMAGVRRGLEVLLAPQPTPVNQTYTDEEMFIG